MAEQKERATGAGGSRTSKSELQGNFTASPEACAKWFTIWRHSHGYLSRSGCEAAFAAHPEWRDA